MHKDFSNIHVLIIDDMATARDYMSRQLRDIGITNIVSVSTIGEAFKNIHDRIDIILCDYYLWDGRNGKDFIEELRKEEKIPDSVVCVMVTAEARFASIIGTAENGIDGYFLKPWNPTDFRVKIQKMIERKELLTPVYEAIERQEYEDALMICNIYLSDREKFWHLEFALRKLRAEVLILMWLFLSAIGDYDAILKKDIIPWALHGKAKCYIKLSRYEEANAMLLKLIKDFPHYMTCYDDLAALYELQGDYARQESILQQAIEKSEEKFHRHKKLAQVALLNDHPELAHCMMETLHKKWLYSPNVDTSSMYLYARILRIRWREKEATEFLTSLKTSFRTQRDKLASIRAITEVYQWVQDLSLSIHDLPPEVQLDYAIQHHQHGDDELLEKICSSIPTELMWVIWALYPDIPDKIKISLEKNAEIQKSNKTQWMRDSIRSPLTIGDWDTARKNILWQLDEVKKHSDLIEMTILFFCRYIQRTPNNTADRELVLVLWWLLGSISQDQKQRSRCALALRQSNITI